MDIKLQEASRQFMRRGQNFFAMQNVDLQVKQGDWICSAGREPAANLDEQNAKEVIAILEEINQKGAKVIVSIHEKNIIFGSNGYEMKHGILNKWRQET